MPRVQREYRMAMGYRILVDHDRRRKDPLSKIVLRQQPFKLALGRPMLLNDEIGRILVSLWS